MVSRVRWSQAISPLCSLQREPLPEPLPVTSLLDQFAEHLSEHGDIERAAAAIRVPEGIGHNLFDTLCKRLGRQAQ